MLKVYVTDGRTLTFDLTDEGQRGEWNSLSASSAFQRTIRAVELLHNHVRQVMPLPRNFRTLRFTAELLRQRVDGQDKVVGERLVCQADMVRSSLTAYHKATSKMVRYDLVRTGRQRFNGVTQARRDT